MQIIGNTKFKIYVYPNDHPPPHCHVRYNDGSDVSVDIPLIMPRYGATITKEVEEMIRKNVDKICKAWEMLNEPKEPITQNANT